MAVLGAQAYTVRNLLTDDASIKNTMVEIKKIGYASVQLYGSAEFAEKCAAAATEEGLLISGILSDLDKCEAEAERYFEVCEKFGIKDLGVSAFYTTLSDALRFIQRANFFAEKVKAKGLTFSYHNHAAEFIKTSDGKTVMEHYIEGFDKELIDFMPDTFWVHSGGFDVRRFIELTNGRVKILHLKDMKRTKEGQKFAEIGNGNLYFEGIIKLALDCGINEFVVEQDECDGDPLLSLKQSYDYIKTLNLI